MSFNSFNSFNNYNKIISLDSKSDYPFNLILNLKDNIIETKKEIELEYVKEFKILKDTDQIKKGGNDIKEAGILIYEY
jgi:hypothetical protein